LRPEETADFHIRWAWSKISRYYNIVASEFNGSMSIGYVLLNIDKQGTPSTKLGPKMGMESRSLTRVLNNLEKEGLIKRIKDGEDKRKMNVFLTDDGKRMRDESKRIVLEFNTTLADTIGRDEFKTFLKTMEKINKHIDTQLTQSQSYKSK
jgi:DNA-binding MarR family transcriptional regulator